MNHTEIKQMLDKLADLRAGQTAIDLQKKELIDQILTPEIKAKLEEIEIEFADKQAAIVASAADLELAVKQAILQYGASVKGEFLHGIWTGGRVSWDTKGLDGYMIAHPEVEAFRKRGEPSVSLRRI